MKRIFLFFVIFISIPFYQAIAAPTEPLNYQAAFDLTAIQKKYTKLMHHLGCAENVFGQEEAEELDDDFDVEGALESYQSECLMHLKSKRRHAIFYHSHQMALDWASAVSIAFVVIPIIGLDTTVGNMVFSGTTYFTGELLKSYGKATYDLWYKPALLLEALEEEYVKNQCFIPQAIWPTIKLKFMMGRDNPYEQQRSIDFIEFALGLTTCKTKAIPSISQKELNEARQSLSKKIDEFFKNYDNFDKEEIELLKVNAKNFLSQLYGRSAQTRYIHLTGPGGIGKTHFARQLVQWIEEICPNSLHLQELKITASDELEGSIQRPGSFLRVLRNQCHANKRGSVVFMDEANWLSDPMFEAPAKRVFNGDQTKLATSYFGDGQEGSGLELDLPPMLVIIASNKTIEEDALRTRFDCVNFPTPSKKALAELAYEIAKKTAVKNHTKGFLKKGKIASKFVKQIDLAIADVTNFREIQSVVPTLMSMWEETDGAFTFTPKEEAAPEETKD